MVILASINLQHLFFIQHSVFFPPKDFTGHLYFSNQQTGKKCHYIYACLMYFYKTLEKLVNICLHFTNKSQLLWNLKDTKSKQRVEDVSKKVAHFFGTRSNLIFCKFGSSCKVAKAMGYMLEKSNWNFTPDGGFRRKFLLS